jgi:hypothetical protein
MDSATFPSPLIGGMGTITLSNLAGLADVSPTLQTLVFDSDSTSNTQYTIVQRGGGAGVIQMTAPALGTATINNFTGNNTINAPVTTDSPLIIDIGTSVADGTSLTFGGNSSLHASSAATPLHIIANINTTNNPGLQTNCTLGMGFADTMAISLNNPGGTHVLYVHNSKNFGISAPSIAFNDLTIVTNQNLSLPAGHMGSLTTALSMGPSAQLFNETGALIEGASLTANGSEQLVTNGFVHISGDVTFTNATNMFLTVSNPNTNPVTVGRGAEFTAGGSFLYSPPSPATIPTISVENDAAVSGAGPCFGAYFELLGPSTIAISNSTDTLANQNTAAALAVTGAGNIGSFFNAPASDLVFTNSADMNNINDAPIANGGVGAKMVLRSYSLTDSQFFHQNQGNITGTNSIGALLVVANDFTISNTMNFLPNQISNLFSTVNGAGAVGTKVEITSGSLALSNHSTLNITNLNNITGNAARGVWIDIQTNNLSLANTNGGFGLFCANGDMSTPVTISGTDAFGTYVHVNGNLTMTNNAILEAHNFLTGLVNPGAVGSRIDVGGTTFSMGNSTRLTIQNEAPLADYGIGAMLDAVPTMQMISGGGFIVQNNGPLSNLTLASNANYATTVNLHGGISTTGGTITVGNIFNFGFPSDLRNAKGVVMNIGDTMSAVCTLNSTSAFITNELSLLPNTNTGIGHSNAITLNVGTMANPIDMILTNTGINASNGYSQTPNIPGHSGSNSSSMVTPSIAIALNASRNIHLTNSGLRLENSKGTPGQGIYINSRGISIPVVGNATIDGTSTITMINEDNPTGGTDPMFPPSNYIGNEMTANAFLLANSSAMSMSNNTSDAATNSIGCRLGVTSLTIQDTAQLNVNNTAGTFSDHSQGNSIAAASLSIQGSGQLNLQNTGGTFTNNCEGSALVVSGTFDMSGLYLTNVSTGETVDGTSFGSLIQSTMPIQVNQGTFINDAEVKADSVPVALGATLAGNGIFSPNIAAGTDVTSHGTVYPGDPTNPITSPSGPTIGTLLINGTYTQESDGNFFVNILNVGTFSKLHVLGTGTADLQGTITVGMVSGAVVTESDTYNIIQTLNGITNQSLNPTVILDPSYTSPLIPQIRYITGPITLAGAPGDNIVQLFFAGGPTPPPSPSPFIPLLTSFSFSFEPLFDLINRDNLILEREMQRMRLRYQHDDALTTKSSSRRIAKASKPAPASISFAQTPTISTIANKIPAESKDLAFARFRNEIEQERIHEEMLSGQYEERPWNFFFGPTGGFGDIDTKKNQIGSDYWTAGALASFNYVFSQIGLGLFVDYDRVQATVHKNWGDFNFDMAHASFYGTYSPKAVPRLAFHSIVGGSYEWYHVGRKTTTGKAKSNTHGGEFDALLTGEYVFSGSPCSNFPENLTIIPRAGVQYIYADSNRFIEHGAGTSDLKIHALHANSLRSILDVWVKYAWEWCNFKFTPELNLGWQREFLDKNHNVYFTPRDLAAPTASVKAYEAGRNTFLAGLDLFLEFYENYALEASYDFQWNSLIQDNGFYLGFHARF